MGNPGGTPRTKAVEVPVSILNPKQTGKRATPVPAVEEQSTGHVVNGKTQTHHHGAHTSRYLRRYQSHTSGSFRGARQEKETKCGGCFEKVALPQRLVSNSKDIYNFNV